jgi:hypothetical protein
VSKRQTVLVAAGLSLVYFAIQLAYLTRLPLVMDEFDGANEAYRLLDLTPYQDFRPYKTVLGYYLQLPPLLFTSDAWTGLLLSKGWLAAINTLAIFAATLSLATIFAPGAALVGQVLLISMTTFLERSSEIRVDMLTAWVGLASLLLLLRREWVAAGLVAGLSFLVSQKAAYAIVAGGAAAGAYWLFEARDRRGFRDLVAFNVATLAVIAAYILAWSLVSSPWTVFSATFLSHGDIAFADMYDLERHWTTTLEKNPLFYWGAAAGLVALAVARWRGAVGATHLVTVVYGSVLFALCRWHKQPWPYFFVILIPALMVVHVAVADMLLRFRRQWLPAAAGMALVLGVAWPFSYLPGVLARDSSYQRRVIRLAASILDEQDTYLAGNDLVYNGRQAHAALRRLSASDVRAIGQWEPARLDALIGELEVARPKLVIRDYRIVGLPAPIGAYLSSRFDVGWGSVWTYAPVVAAGASQFDIWFDGEYRVESPGDAVIDDQSFAPGAVITLRRGGHRNASASPVRLRLQVPQLAGYSGPVPGGASPLFRGVYDY